jgi:hypothetical protein
MHSTNDGTKETRSDSDYQVVTAADPHKFGFFDEYKALRPMTAQSGFLPMRTTFFTRYRPAAESDDSAATARHQRTSDADLGWFSNSIVAARA